ncbi:hypothetical protein JZU51_01980, partial [bacterium]|nr:hypothetical protein [bacterium]
VGMWMKNLGNYLLLLTPPAAVHAQIQPLDSCVPLANDGEAFANGVNEFISRSKGEVGGAELAHQFQKDICK